MVQNQSGDILFPGESQFYTSGLGPGSPAGAGEEPQKLVKKHLFFTIIPVISILAEGDFRQLSSIRGFRFTVNKSFLFFSVKVQVKVEPFLVDKMDPPPSLNLLSILKNTFFVLVFNVRE